MIYYYNSIIIQLIKKYFEQCLSTYLSFTTYYHIIIITFVCKNMTYNYYIDNYYKY